MVTSRMGVHYCVPPVSDIFQGFFLAFMSCDLSCPCLFNSFYLYPSFSFIIILSVSLCDVNDFSIVYLATLYF